ncbi:hypothetical protein AXF42_Ash019441 [Apostasia shenzhenica]|uniref:Uncharacterized protein n=1 Tax=Apostasia shenzhenica TaxID=1088818 RepID=A0A2I0AYD8_9ASPA|nr:hypothetical protein AXF42_Ash019441 [Apostasia shenzhenica]
MPGSRETLAFRSNRSKKLQKCCRVVPGWHFAISKNIGECRSVETRDWRWDDLREERSPGPPTSARFESAVRRLENVMVSGDFAASQAFGFPWSSRGCVSFQEPLELPGLHPARCAASYLMVPPNKC